MTQAETGTNVIVLGAGAAGLMCALEAGRRGRRVRVLELNDKPGKKILISGGGRCNFTNLNVRPECYLSANPHFCKSALSRYTAADFIALLQKHGVAFHEKKLGQLFCDGSARQIVDLLLAECQKVGVRIQLGERVQLIRSEGVRHFVVQSSGGTFTAQSVVVATGGLSVPTIGISALGYDLARQFGVGLQPTRAGLVPFTLTPTDLQRFALLSGVSAACEVSTARQMFAENLLLTHRGLSGPAILQLSSYWQAGEAISVNWLPGTEFEEFFAMAQRTRPEQEFKTWVGETLPKRLVPMLVGENVGRQRLKSFSARQICQIGKQLQEWTIIPAGTEGYRTAEVTVGGVDCDALSPQTMECRKVPGLYFIGEVVDVTGWLGGYNFQWAWSSGWAAGQSA